MLVSMRSAQGSGKGYGGGIPVPELLAPKQSFVAVLGSQTGHLGTQIHAGAARDADLRRGHLEMGEFLHKELTESIIGAFFEVYNLLKPGYLESVYQNALAVRLRNKGFAVQREVPFQVIFDGVEVGFFRADLICEQTVLIEIKAGERLPPNAFYQTLNYLRTTNLPVGLLLHFGIKASFQRIVPGTDLRRSASREAPA